MPVTIAAAIRVDPKQPAEGQVRCPPLGSVGARRPGSWRPGPAAGVEASHADSVV